MKRFQYDRTKMGYISQPNGGNSGPGGKTSSYRSTEPNDVKTPDFIRRLSKYRNYETPKSNGRKSTGTPNTAKA